MTNNTADALATIHAAAFENARSWTAQEFQTLLESDHVFAVTAAEGFALGRVVLDEVELLTIAVRPKARGEGLGRRLLQDFETQAVASGATRAFLEVAQDNIAALALYHAANWTESGRRAGYYARTTGKTVDAILFSKWLTQGELPEK